MGHILTSYSLTFTVVSCSLPNLRIYAVLFRHIASNVKDLCVVVAVAENGSASWSASLPGRCLSPSGINAENKTNDPCVHARILDQIQATKTNRR
jgi:hypothetical protein